MARTPFRIPLFQYPARTGVNLILPYGRGNADGAVTTATGVSIPGYKFATQGQVFEPVQFTTQVQISIEWFLPLSQPTPKSILRASTALTFVPFIQSQDWYQPWSEPVRSLAGLKPPLQQYIAFYPFITPTAEVVTVDKWFISLSDPTRKLPGLSAVHQQFLAYIGADPFAETVTEDRWHQTWSEPVRTLSGLKTHLQQTSTSFDPFPIPAVTIDGAVVTASGIAVPGIRQPIRSEIFEPVTVTATPTVTIDMWFSAFSDPIRKNTDRRAASYESTFWSNFTPPTVIFNYGWFSALSTPIRSGIKVSPSTIDFIAVTASSVVTIDMWHRALAEPTRRKLGLSAIHQQFLAYIGAAPFNETVTESRWHQPWSEPVRQKPGLKTSLQQTLALDPFPRPNQVVVESQWHQSWSLPVLYRGIRPQFQQTLAFSPFPIAAETITVDKWFHRLSEPVRQKRGLLAMHQQFLALVKATPFPETVTESRWHQAWSEPVRVKPRLRTGLHQYLAFYPTPILATPINITMDATETKDTFFGYAGLYNTATGANVSIHEIRENRAEVSIIES